MASRYDVMLAMEAFAAAFSAETVHATVLARPAMVLDADASYDRESQTERLVEPATSAVTAGGDGGDATAMQAVPGTCSTLPSDERTAPG